MNSATKVSNGEDEGSSLNQSGWTKTRMEPTFFSVVALVSFKGTADTEHMREASR